MNYRSYTSVIGIEIVTLVAPPETLRSLAKTLRERNRPYRISRIEFINHNSYWNGKRGLGIKCSHKSYESLYKQP